MAIPATSKLDEFYEAEIYAEIGDEEYLCAKSPVDYFVRHFETERYGYPELTVAQYLEDLPESVELHGLRRAKVGRAFFESEAEVAIENAVERFMEEYGNPELNEEDSGFTSEVVAAIKPKMAALIEELYSYGVVWECYSVGKRSFTRKQIETMLRSAKPEWFA